MSRRPSPVAHKQCQLILFIEKQQQIQYKTIQMSETLDQYLWIAVTAGIVGFVYTFGIGANDVANACKFRASLSLFGLTIYSFPPCLSIQ